MEQKLINVIKDDYRELISYLENGWVITQIDAYGKTPADAGCYVLLKKM